MKKTYKPIFLIFPNTRSGIPSVFTPMCWWQITFTYWRRYSCPKTPLLRLLTKTPDPKTHVGHFQDFAENSKKEEEVTQLRQQCPSSLSIPGFGKRFLFGRLGEVSEFAWSLNYPKPMVCKDFDQLKYKYCRPKAIYVRGDNLRYFIINFVKFFKKAIVGQRNYLLSISTTYRTRPNWQRSC